MWMKKHARDKIRMAIFKWRTLGMLIAVDGNIITQMSKNISSTRALERMKLCFRFRRPFRPSKIFKRRS